MLNLLILAILVAGVGLLSLDLFMLAIVLKVVAMFVQKARRQK